MVRLLSIAVVICIAGILAADDRDFEQGALIRFEGEIGPGLDAYFYRKLNKARSAGADLIILEIDSPGGTVFHSFGIAEHLRDIVMGPFEKNIPCMYNVSTLPDTTKV